jgi:hypothetical protein
VSGLLIGAEPERQELASGMHLQGYSNSGQNARYEKEHARFKFCASISLLAFSSCFPTASDTAAIISSFDATAPTG